jgi:solute carrier family 25 (mitochondrial carnitine/acylcarnitine transporter), member 20/29
MYTKRSLLIFHFFFITLSLLLLQHSQFGNMVFFGSYEYFKRSLPKLRAQLQQRQQHSTASSSSSAAIAAQPDHASIALAGGLAGMSFWGSVHPIDLVKSLIQTDNLRNPRFSGMADCFRQVVAERGLTGMYRSVLLLTLV